MNPLMLKRPKTRKLNYRRSPHNGARVNRIQRHVQPSIWALSVAVDTQIGSRTHLAPVVGIFMLRGDNVGT